MRSASPRGDVSSGSRVEDQPRIVAGDLQQVGVDLDARHLKARRAGLAGAEQFAFAAQLQILLGDAEPSSVSRMTDSRRFAVSPSGSL